MDKWLCLRVIIDFVFDHQQPKLDRAQGEDGLYEEVEDERNNAN